MLNSPSSAAAGSHLPKTMELSLSLGMIIGKGLIVQEWKSFTYILGEMGGLHSFSHSNGKAHVSEDRFKPGIRIFCGPFLIHPDRPNAG